VLREKLKPPSEIYFEKAAALSESDAELLNQSVLGRFTRRQEDKARNLTEILALQLEFEDKQLVEWRSRLSEMRQLSKTIGDLQPA